MRQTTNSMNPTITLICARCRIANPEFLVALQSEDSDIFDALKQLVDAHETSHHIELPTWQVIFRVTELKKTLQEKGIKLDCEFIKICLSQLFIRRAFEYCVKQNFPLPTNMNNTFTIRVSTSLCEIKKIHEEGKETRSQMIRTHFASENAYSPDRLSTLISNLEDSHTSSQEALAEDAYTPSLGL